MTSIQFFIFSDKWNGHHYVYGEGDGTSEILFEGKEYSTLDLTLSGMNN